MRLIVIDAGADWALLAADLELEGAEVTTVSPDVISGLDLSGFDALLIPPVRSVMTAELVGACDRAGVRLVPIGSSDSRVASRFGLPSPLPLDTPAAEVMTAVAAEQATKETAVPARSARVLAVWGPQGAPGRTTVAIQLAVELVRAGRRCAPLDTSRP